MSNTYTKAYIHYVFSTKRRQPKIKTEIESNLWSYLGGIAEKHRMIPIKISGTANHVHCLVILPPTISVAKGAQLLKGGSSKWLNDHQFTDRSFRWQKGYGAFSVSESKVSIVSNYIRNQKEHHRKRTFEDEYLEFLRQYRIMYDVRYVFD